MSIETPEQLAGLRRAGAVVAEVLRTLQAAVKQDVTTGELDALAAETMAARGARSGPILTYGYPGSVCLSIDDEVVHGIPGDRVLRDGELITLDVALELDGYHADAATTVAVGEADGTARRLVAAARAALQAGIRAARPGATLRTSAPPCSASRRHAASGSSPSCTATASAGPCTKTRRSTTGPIRRAP